MAASGEEEEDRLQQEAEEMMASGADYVEYDLNEILDEAEGEGEDNDGDDDDDEQEQEDDSVLQFRGHKDSVYCVSVHPSRPWALSGDGDDSFCVWSLEDASVIYHEQAHADTIIAASFNFDGEYFATASMDGIVKVTQQNVFPSRICIALNKVFFPFFPVQVWATEDGKLKHTLEGPSDDLEWMQWHPKGNVVACGGADTTVWIYDTIRGECLNVLAGHEDSVLCGDFTPSGKQIVTSGADGWTKLWSPKTGKCTQTLSVQEWHSGPIVSQSCAYSRPLVATGSIDSTMKIANLQTNKCLSTVRFASTNSAGAAETSEDENAPSVESVAFAPNVNWVAGGANNGKVIIFDLDDGSVRLVDARNEPS